MISESKSRHAFWFEPGFDEKIKSHILKNQFPDACLACQAESHRWHKKILDSKLVEPDDLEIHDGMYYPSNKELQDGEGHTWLEVKGKIFDPTAKQFDDFGRGDYHLTDIVDYDKDIATFEFAK